MDTLNDVVLTTRIRFARNIKGYRFPYNMIDKQKKEVLNYIKDRVKDKYNVLELNNIDGLIKIGYILIYILFFLIDDLAIFIIAMLTLKISGVTTKYSKFAHLVGGIIMIIIGLLLIFKPEWIMLNF